jgi:hypothetical protein
MNLNFLPDMGRMNGDLHLLQLTKRRVRLCIGMAIEVSK